MLFEDFPYLRSLQIGDTITYLRKGDNIVTTTMFNSYDEQKRTVTFGNKTIKLDDLKNDYQYLNEFEEIENF